ELGIIAVLTASFLFLFPRRNPWVDVGLATTALVFVTTTARYTKSVIWAASPCRTENRFKQCVKITSWITVPAVVMFFLTGGIMAYQSGGWPSIVERIFDWKILVVFAAYIGWAFVQQTLFQFYLLGRLLALFPKNQLVWPILITGLGF